MEFDLKPVVLTSDLTDRYKISKKTLWSWQGEKTMPKGFASPFPTPDWPGRPNRWRRETILAWECKCGDISETVHQ